MTRLKLQTRKRRRLGGGRDESVVQVPVTIPPPDDEIMEHPRLKR